ncbi:MAG: carbamoyltransferase, partial [Candidatus Omnitrophica bacterium]|nr:carbamoyltransferase [Candidatus Omnitrophota bacterium]
MIILGIGSPFPHDPAAAIVADGKIRAAADEERFIREKHAKDKLAVNAVKFCLEKTGVKAKDVDVVAYPWSFGAYLSSLPRYVARCWRTRPSRAFKAVSKTFSSNKNAVDILNRTLAACGIPSGVKKYFIEHHMAHASSA